MVDHLTLKFRPDPQPEGESLLQYGRRLHRVEMQRLKMKHRAGMEGWQVVLHRSLLMDFLVGQIYCGRSEASPGNPLRPPLAGMALVALGGYGRQELAPFSDVDLMLLRKSRQSQEENRQIENMLCLLWDMGFQVGHSVRTVKETQQMGQEDLISLVSMLDARFLVGDGALFEEFEKKLGRLIEKKRKPLEEKFILSIQERHESQGGTAFIQEPNIKEAIGGLRDFHSISWFAKAFHPGIRMEEVLARNGISSTEWKRTLLAYEFLQRLRNELHFTTNRHTDTLSHAVLGSVIRSFSFTKDRFQKDSESFLKHYYLQVGKIARVLEAVLASLKTYPRKNTPWLVGKLVNFPGTKSANKKTHVSEIQSTADPEKWMQLFRFSQAQPSLLTEQAKVFIRRSLQQFNRSAFSKPSIGADFRAILRSKGKVAPVVRQMHGLGFLGRVLPEFGRLTCLVQHDLYHKYTTDEHTLRALDVLDQVALGNTPKHEAYRKVFNEIHDSSSLYFALLMHDIGKGLGGGHSAKGAVLVTKALSRLRFDPDEAEKIQTLVRYHLLMGHVSQRRNLDDSHTIQEFVKTVGQPDILNMLLLMTYADALAVGPGVWTDWKDTLLWELYYKAYDRMMFSDETSPSNHVAVENIRRQVMSLLENEVGARTMDNHFRRLPEKYVLYTPVEQIVEHLRLARELQKSEVVVEWVDHPDQGYSDLILVTRDHPGLFAQIAGGLSSFNLNILSAQLNTRDDGMVFDVFQVGSRTGAHRLYREDYPRVEKLLKKVISGQVDIGEYLKSHSRPSRSHGADRTSIPPKVHIDNETSLTATVIEVQVDDRIGLGYQIAKTLADLGLNITFAKLATEKTHAFDVFYVQNRKGAKIEDSAEIANIAHQLKTDLVGLS